MPFKTILVYLSSKARAEHLMRAAVPLARRSNAHLIGLYVLPPPVIASDLGMSYGAQIVTLDRSALEKEAEEIRKLFEASTKGETLVAEWRLVDSLEPDTVRTVIEHARASDIVVVSQSDSSTDPSPLIDAPERLTLESGRPVLIVPHTGRFDHIGERVLVAWNNRREASRAVFDALPLLEQARDVRVLWINPQKDGVEPEQLPTAEIAAALSRHGVKATAAYSVARDIDAGNEILSRAADEGADL
ncbi:MAG: universal stress protein, partial [Parvularculaceae bacterium]|nr:universal stress protein [Parvularculaceae bacterium]